MVAARETTLQELLGGEKQYQIPLYQRTYSWGREQLDKLWEDILQLAEDRMTRPDLTHFLGSLVLTQSPLNGPSGVSDWLVIDGQQRLTTVSLLLCAIRDHLAQQDPRVRDKINELYLINKWHEDRYTKLKPTQADRDAYVACVTSTPQAGGPDRVGSAYRFFKAKLASLSDQDDEEQQVTAEAIEKAVISGLSIVAVTADASDNAYRIFESLNNTGLKLTQADLLRNYLFMRLPTHGENVYRSLWLPLQDSLSPQQLEMLFWIDLVQRDPRIKQTEIHAEQQKRLDRMATEAEIESEIARFNKLGTLFQKILAPDTESSPQVRQRLQRVQAWGTTTSYPFLLYALELRDRGQASSDEIARAMLYLESFLVRRLIIGRATAGLNRTLYSLVSELDKSRPIDEAIRTYLSTGRKHYATDGEITAAMTTMPFYLNGRAVQRKLVLQWLEESYDSREPVSPDRLTIEHLLPQTLTPEWLDALSQDLPEGETVDRRHESLVHTLGNLTLTGYNSSLSNSPFPRKRELLAASGLAMNQEIAREPRWGRTEILARGDRMASRISRIWPGPVAAEEPGPQGPAWTVAISALAAMPSGTWTTYGDIATLVGTHPIQVGTYLANSRVPNAHRALTANGEVAEGFRWLDNRTETARDVLEREGVSFDERGRANQEQRLRVEDLAQLADITVEDQPEAAPASLF